ncbi:MAG: pyridoxamine 5'-phosphate oxidase family protein [Actinobacteria bacterium]|nr:pyridoxamine 5'-phosphate oxidase family protein [Actinomycetota bacterium]
MTGPTAPETLPVPASHLDLLTRPICGVFTTLGHDGRPQSSLVGVDLDRGCPLVNTCLDRQIGRNLTDNQKVSLLVVDPRNTSRFIQIRGDAELVTRNAREHLDGVICRIHPRRITLDAIHIADH